MTSPEMVSEAELVAAAHAIHIAKHEGDTTRAEKTWRYVSRLRRAQAFAALTAAAQVRAQEETAVLDSYAVENQRFHDEITRLRDPYRAVDDEDWQFVMAKLGDGGRSRFWKAVLTEARTALGIRTGEKD